MYATILLHMIAVYQEVVRINHVSSVPGFRVKVWSCLHVEQTQDEVLPTNYVICDIPLFLPVFGPYIIVYMSVHSITRPAAAECMR